MDSSGSAIKIENVWKVFGNTSSEALDAIQNKKISKNERKKIALKQKQIKDNEKMIAKNEEKRKKIESNF